jgi:hypothetical protein
MLLSKGLQGYWSDGRRIWHWSNHYVIFMDAFNFTHYVIVKRRKNVSSNHFEAISFTTSYYINLNV